MLRESASGQPWTWPRRGFALYHCRIKPRARSLEDRSALGCLIFGPLALHGLDSCFAIPCRQTQRSPRRPVGGSQDTSQICGLRTGWTEQASAGQAQASPKGPAGRDQGLPSRKKAFLASSGVSPAPSGVSPASSGVFPASSGVFPPPSGGVPPPSGGVPPSFGGVPSAVRGRPSVVRGRPSVVRGRPSVVRGRPSAVWGVPSAVRGRPGIRPKHGSDRRERPAELDGLRSISGPWGETKPGCSSGLLRPV
jgi:hypothetical protein